MSKHWPGKSFSKHRTCALLHILKLTSMSVLAIRGRKCTLAASRVAPGESRWVCAAGPVKVGKKGGKRQADGRTPASQGIALTGRNRTGPPRMSAAGAPERPVTGVPTVHAPGRPARRQHYRRRQTTPTVDNVQNNTGPLGGPVIIDYWLLTGDSINEAMAFLTKSLIVKRRLLLTKTLTKYPGAVYNYYWCCCCCCCCCVWIHKPYAVNLRITNNSDWSHGRPLSSLICGPLQSILCRLPRGQTVTAGPQFLRTGL